MAPSDAAASTRAKRKLQNGSRATSTPQVKQPTISQAFYSSEHKQTAGSHSLSELSPNSKRRKLFQLDEDQQVPPNQLKEASAENMYNFSGATTNGHAVIDLTKASPASTKSRRLSGGPQVKNATPYTGAKKLIVKNLRTTPKSDPNQFCKQTTEQLDAALTAIFNNERPALSNEELYRGAENVCKLGKAAGLANLVTERCNGHVQNDLKQRLMTRAGDKNVDLLRAVLESWSVWNKQLLLIRGVFFYLDRSYLLQTHQPSLHDTAVRQFRTHIFSEPILKSKVLDGVCDLLLADRTGSSSDQGLFSGTIKMFHDLGVYTSEFEPRMLALSQDYISSWADQAISERTLSEYVSASVKFMDSEMRRCDVFDLDLSTKRDLLTLLEDHVIERQESELTNLDSVADLLDINATESLAQLFSLLQRRRLGEKLKGPFTQWIDDTGTEIVFNDKEQDQMVIRLLELKQKLDSIWRFPFQKNEVLGHALREAFEQFINKSKKTSATWNTDNSKPGEMIAKYVDMLLKAGAKAIPTNLVGSTTKSAEADDEGDDDVGIDEDSAVNAQLDQVLDLFRFVHGKAVFEAFYKKDFARRLLMGRSASKDAERSMLARLKTECGAGFTQNLEQMFKDMDLTREEMASFKMRMEQSESKPAIDLNVNILMASAWPFYPDLPVAIPRDIQRIMDNFERHYNSKHSGRKLQWKHSMAHCQLKADFPKGNKEMVVSAFQAIVLLLFNNVAEGQHLGYEQIKAESGLADQEARRTLQSLACAKLRPLTKHPKGRDINDGDTFTVNTSFSHEKYRVKVNTIQLKETKEENKETHERVAQDRQYETQAAIVRIMKSRKSINHSELVAEVISATKTRGTLNVGDIKKNIDKLIEKEYMERIENNAYSYLA